MRPAGLVALLGCVAMLESSGNGVLRPVQIRVGTLSLSKLPFAIAEREGLWARYGLDADFWVTPARSKYGVVREFLFGPPDIRVDGAAPQMVESVSNPDEPFLIFIGGTDCRVRAHIIGRPGMTSIDDLAGGRIGISTRTSTTTGFVALRLARRMGWTIGDDLEIVTGSRDVGALREGRVDAIVATEFRHELARREGFPVLEDAGEWGLAIAGNSVKVEPAWLGAEGNREIARRFMMATIEALAILHEDRERTLDILESWPTVPDRAFAESVLDQSATISRVPWPCHEGIELTMELYDSPAMRRFQAIDFYDDGIVRGLVDEGFVDRIYEDVRARAAR